MKFGQMIKLVGMYVRRKRKYPTKFKTKAAFEALKFGKSKFWLNSKYRIYCEFYRRYYNRKEHICGDAINILYWKGTPHEKIEKRAG